MQTNNNYNFTQEELYEILFKCVTENYRNHEKEYFKNELFIEVTLIKYVSNYLNSNDNLYYNPIPNKPMSPSSSAIIGSAIGGISLGVASGLSSVSKNIEYQQEMENHKNRLHDHIERVYEAKKNLAELYPEIMDCINRSEKAKYVWEAKVQQYVNEKTMPQPSNSISGNNNGIHNKGNEELYVPIYKQNKKEGETQRRGLIGKKTSIVIASLIAFIVLFLGGFVIWDKSTAGDRGYKALKNGDYKKAAELYTKANDKKYSEYSKALYDLDNLSYGDDLGAIYSTIKEYNYLDNIDELKNKYIQFYVIDELQGKWIHKDEDGEKYDGKIYKWDYDTSLTITRDRIKKSDRSIKGGRIESDDTYYKILAGSENTIKYSLSGGNYSAILTYDIKNDKIKWGDWEFERE